MNTEFENRKFIIFAVDHYNTLGVARSLGEAGIHPFFIAQRGKAELAAKSKYVEKVHYVDSIADGYALLLEEYGHEEKRPFVYTIDDHSMGFLDERYEEWKEKFISFNANKNNGINQYIDKWEILEKAQQCGLHISETRVVNRGEIPPELKYPIITKSISPNVGGWKSDVHICKSEQELKNAFERIQSPKVLLQRYIEKKNELEYYGFSIRHGEEVFLSIGANYLYLIPGFYSPYMNIFVPPYPEIQEKIADIIKQIGFEGIFSCEFVVDESDNLYFLEINFRNATWSYSSTHAGMNLPYLWAKSTLEGKIDPGIKKEFSTFRAMVEPIDYGKRVDTGKVALAEWLRDFKEAECTYYYNRDDIEPFMSLCEKWERLK